MVIIVNKTYLKTIQKFIFFLLLKNLLSCASNSNFSQLLLVWFYELDKHIFMLSENLSFISLLYHSLPRLAGQHRAPGRLEVKLFV